MFGKIRWKVIRKSSVKMPKTDNSKDNICTIICPSEEELSVITNNILCVTCGLVFNNEPRYRMHDARVHKKISLEKTKLDNVRYHCPVKSCIYAVTSDKYFTMMKYIKQHYLKVHAEKIYSCTQCPKSFSTEAARKAHTKICGISFICICNKIFNSYGALLTHAKRYSHNVDAKYKPMYGKNGCSKESQNLSSYIVLSNENKPVYQIQTPTPITPVYLVLNVAPKVTCNVAVQTEEPKKSKRLVSTVHESRHNRIKKTQHTQTNLIPKKKRHKKSIQTQTLKTEQKLTNNFVNVSENLFSESPLPLQHDVALQDFWEDKKICGTQTSPEKNLFEQLDEVSTSILDKVYQSSNENYTHKGVSSLDPLLTERTYRNNLKSGNINNSSSIETQTDAEYSKLFDDPDELSRYFVSSSNNETQTTEDFDDFEPMHIYSNMYTQTCDDIFSNTLTISDIQTQTSYLPISTKTQTKLENKTEFNCPVSHMETQTNLLHMFDDFDE